MDDANRRPGEPGTQQLRFVADGSGRLDTLAAAAFPEMSRARLQRLIAGGSVLVNGEPARKSAGLDAGDAVEVTIVEHEPAPLPAPVGAIPVLYEDDELLIIDKPAGLNTHGGPGDEGPSVAGWFLARYPEAARHFDVERPGIVHRLDKDTTGALALAKTPAAQTALSAAFADRISEKHYLAICEGVPAQPRAAIDAPIGRHPGDRTRMAIVKAGREARSEYEMLAEGRGRSLLDVRLHTGRTHQARVHLAAVNCPVVGDSVYGRKHAAGRQQLHAWRLKLPHPRGGSVEVTAPLPSDMRETLQEMGLGDLLPRFEQAGAVREP